MKKMLILAAALLLGGAFAHAALTEKDLTPSAIQKTIAATPVAGRQTAARQILEAIAAQPMDDTAKAQALLSASRALIQGGGSIAIIAELFNSIPVAYLQSVAERLARENFDQQVNGMTDEQYDTFCAKVVSGASKYIEASGTDSPAVRISILAATFSAASSDPERTRPQMIAALPPAMQAAAATFVLASEQGDRDVIAAAAGVDEVAESVSDPDADKVVEVKQEAPAEEPAAEAAPAEEAVAESAAAATVVAAVDPAIEDDPADEAPVNQTVPAMEPEADYLEPAPPPATSDAAESGDEAPAVKVPLLSRFADDALGAALDAHMTTLYAWDAGDILPPTIDFDPVPELIPGEMTPAGFQAPMIEEDSDEPPVAPEPIIPSPPYGNQAP